MNPEFEVYHILAEGAVNGSNMVSREEVDMWATEFMQNYPVLMGDGSVQQRLYAGYGPTIGLPFNLIVDRETMVVKGHLQGGWTDAKTLCDQ